MTTDAMTSARYNILERLDTRNESLCHFGAGSIATRHDGAAVTVPNGMYLFTDTSARSETSKPIEEKTVKDLYARGWLTEGKRYVNSYVISEPGIALVAATKKATKLAEQREARDFTITGDGGEIKMSDGCNGTLHLSIGFEHTATKFGHVYSKSEIRRILPILQRYVDTGSVKVKE